MNSANQQTELCHRSFIITFSFTTCAGWLGSNWLSRHTVFRASSSEDSDHPRDFKKMLFQIKPAKAGVSIKPRASALGSGGKDCASPRSGRQPMSAARFTGLNVSLLVTQGSAPLHPGLNSDHPLRG